MKGYRWKTLMSLLSVGLMISGLWGCAAKKPTPTAKVQVIPEKFFLSPGLIKKPVQFKGSGFNSKEMVVVEMVLPEGLKVKGIGEDEDLVGLAYGKADAKGNFQAAMRPTATLDWFFQVGWTPNLKPDFKQAKPIPPGKYEIRATGMDSEIFGVTNMEIVPPPKKKK